MVEWFQQQLETRNCQQSQRWCWVHGNRLHLEGVQQPGQQGDWNSTNIYEPLTQMRETINGYMWSFQLPINVKYLNTEDTSLTWAFQQCFQYGGLTMLANMEPTICLKLVKYTDSNCINLKNRSQRWRSTPWFQQPRKVHLGQQQDGDPATTCQATRAWSSAIGITVAETTKENEIEGDDNMERPTNRQRLMWNINNWSQQRINRVR